MLTAKCISLTNFTLAGRVASYIQLHAFDHPELLQYNLLERHFGACSTRLQQLFKNQYGQTIHEYIVQVRHLFICDLLTNTGKPVKIIALEAGYSELSNFSRDFKKIAGVAPTVYRQQQKLNIHTPIAMMINIQE